MVSRKVVSLEELSVTCDSLRNEGKIIVQCHGVFDQVHIGHIRHFLAAKKFGDVLIVTVTTDEYVNKGPNRPKFNVKSRVEFLKELECVDYVAISNYPRAVEAIRAIRPNIYAKGNEYEGVEDGVIDIERRTVDEIGGRVIYTNEETFSSTSILNTDMLPIATREYLSDFSKKYSIETVIDYLNNVKDLKVLVIGEAIIDEYQYGMPMGPGGKEQRVPTFTVNKIEKYFGGSLALANHISNLCNNVSLLALADERANELLIPGLHKNIDATFFNKKDSPTVVKRRFVNQVNNSRLFEVYEINSGCLSEEESSILANKIGEHILDYDLVLVCDFGHGMFTKQVRRVLIDQAAYLVICAQANSGNWGTNSIRKYFGRTSDVFFCLDGNEFKFATHELYDDYSNIPSLIKDFDNMIITLGKDGCAVRSDGEPVVIPPFATNVIDTTGAGDAFLSVTALLLCRGVPMEVVGFVGNVAGMIATTYHGNKNYVTKNELDKQIKGLLRWKS